MNSVSKLTFIGSGNMASSIIGGLIKQQYPASAITACDPSQQALDVLSKQFGINTNTSNQEACVSSDVIILAVKPQILKIVCEQLNSTLTQRSQKPLIISIAAGIPSQQIQTWLGQESIALVRCMPNTPSLVQQGASGLYATNSTSEEQKVIASQLLEAVGCAIWLEDESLIDAVTAVSGSGPAYFFLFMESMIDAGIKQGLTREAAAQLTLQTALGAATLAQNSEVDVSELRRRVTSPGGTTEQAIISFEDSELRQVVDKAMVACADRSKAMAKELS